MVVGTVRECHRAPPGRSCHLHVVWCIPDHYTIHGLSVQALRGEESQGRVGFGQRHHIRSNHYRKEVGDACCFEHGKGHRLNLICGDRQREGGAAQFIQAAFHPWGTGAPRRGA